MSRHSGVMVVDKQVVAPKGAPEVQPATSAASAVAPIREAQDVEVVPKQGRRFFTAKFKRGILEKLKACKGDGDIGDLLRSNGLYSSHISTWKGEVEKQELAALKPRKRGPKPKLTGADRELVALRKESLMWRARAERAELLVEIQKKVALLLGNPLSPTESEHS